MPHSIEIRTPNAVVSGQQFVFGYRPNLPGNILYLVIFSVCLIAQCLLGIRFRTWFFMGGAVCCLTLEILGYAARIMMNLEPLERSWFLMSNCCLTLGPAFLAASIYYCLNKIVAFHGQAQSRLQPRTYTVIFILCDATNLVLQGAGGGIASSASNTTTTNIGIDVIVTGLVAQVVSLLVFIVFAAHFANGVRQRERTAPNLHAQLFRKTAAWNVMMAGLIIATFAIFGRSCFRIAELSQGYSWPIANNETLFMVFEGAMIIVAVAAATALHPGFCFSQPDFTIERGREKTGVSNGRKAP